MNKGGKQIMRKLLGQTTVDRSTENNSIESPQLRPSASQTSVHSAGASIACLDRSPDGQRAVIAGSKLFKILKVDGATIKEELDLRAIISSYANNHDPSAATPEQLTIKAVKWSHSALDSTIVTACGNGRMTVYDLNHGGDGFEIGRINEHNRQVHKLDISPYKENWLLSASQDGTVRVYDLRTPRGTRGGNGASFFRTWHMFKCNAESVRDVKWSPTDGFEFACCTEAGQVQKWDIRKPGAPVLKIAAHQKCSSIDWHPDGKHLVSGGNDQFCHVWDLSKSADRNQKPRYSFATPAPVSTVSWRPATWSATAQGLRAAQITVSYDDTTISKTQNSRVHIWDLARPSMPFKEIEQWDTAPTGVVWNTRDLLWAVDREGRFSQTDVAFSPKVIERKSLSTFAFSPTGDTLMFLEERQVYRRRSRPLLPSPDVLPSFQHSNNGPLLSVSRSDSEEDVVGSFLGPTKARRHRRRRSGQSNQSFSSTPPTSTGATNKPEIMPLDDGVKVTGVYKPQQVIAIGRAPSTAKRATHQYFTNKYLTQLWRFSAMETGVVATNEKIKIVTEEFAKTAEMIGHYRLAQTWRILGYTMNLLLTRRAEHHRQNRLKPPEPTPKKDMWKEQLAAFDARNSTRHGSETPRRRQRGDRTPRRQDHASTPLDSPRNRSPRSYSRNHSPRHHKATTIIHDEMESTSNVATPLVRPVRDHVAAPIREAMHTPINIDDDKLDLAGKTSAATPSPIPVPGAFSKESSVSPSIDGYDFYGIDSLSPVVDFHVPQRKQPLRLDYANDTQQIIQPGLQRHDSGESFQMFSTSNESQQTKFLSSSVSDRDTSLRDRVHSWESSLPNHPRVRLNSEALTDSSVEPVEGSSGANSSVEQSAFPYESLTRPKIRVQEPSMQSNTHTLALGPIEETAQSPTATDKPIENPNIIERDFLPQAGDPSFTISPIDAATLVQRSIDFETQSGSLHASIMVLLFRSLLPASAIDSTRANAIIGQYHYRLTTFQLHLEAALLRNLSTPVYPSVFSVAQENINCGFFCTSCQKPIENDPLIPNSVWRCTRCERATEPCAICHHRELDSSLDFETLDVPVPTSTWWYCPGCGHGGHTACMSAWHGISTPSEHSKGCCPLEGCLHPCLPGEWRTQRAEEKKTLKDREMANLVRENSRMGSRGAAAMGRGVRRDGREVAQSKAVEGVRVALGMAAGERGLERKKSVKLVAPGEEGV
ncbi:WD40 repeat-like protein [Glarea lozoyensis ATCC 20868]|uniref:WD40 repeat-like protein n=1 Tax=Glarea lozoyensis (strain ATCC 20868 / MF5171) TaxID=1116229 RepID=S3DD17_GLAL2|nr:WD40 repeat-like protein [Glarea lozoyensis ATCC 20868]EPE24588.1 WD40 repeat-like protein [Glarea lozoyensis ATCC 20868]